MTTPRHGWTEVAGNEAANLETLINRLANEADTSAAKQTDLVAHTSAAAPHSGHETPAGAQAKVNAHAALIGTAAHGLGTLSTQAANAVAITGGTIAGLTGFSVAGGGGEIAGDFTLTIGDLRLPNTHSLLLKDTAGTTPYLTCQADNNTVFYGTDASGASRGVWSVLARSSTAPLRTLVPLEANQAITLVNYNGNDGLIFDRPVGNHRLVSWRTGGVARWAFGANDDAESGGNAGSNLILARYADGTGAFLSTVFEAFRATGGVAVGGAPDPGANNLAVQGNATALGTLGIGTTSPGGQLEVAQSQAGYAALAILRNSSTTQAHQAGLEWKLAGISVPTADLAARAVCYTTDTGNNSTGVCFQVRNGGTDSLVNALRIEQWSGRLLLALGGAPATDQTYGGSGVFFLSNVGTVPTGTPFLGGLLYVEGGSLKFKGSSGTITTIAPA